MSVIIIIIYIFSKKKNTLLTFGLSKRGKAAGRMSVEKETKNPARQGLERGSEKRKTNCGQRF